MNPLNNVTPITLQLYQKPVTFSLIEVPAISYFSLEVFKKFKVDLDKSSLVSLKGKVFRLKDLMDKLKKVQKTNEKDKVASVLFCVLGVILAAALVLLGVALILTAALSKLILLLALILILLAVGLTLSASIIKPYKVFTKLPRIEIKIKNQKQHAEEDLKGFKKEFDSNNNLKTLPGSLQKSINNFTKKSKDDKETYSTALKELEEAQKFYEKYLADEIEIAVEKIKEN